MTSTSFLEVTHRRLFKETNAAGLISIRLTGCWLGVKLRRLGSSHSPQFSTCTPVSPIRLRMNSGNLSDRGILHDFHVLLPLTWRSFERSTFLFLKSTKQRLGLGCSTCSIISILEMCRATWTVTGLALSSIKSLEVLGESLFWSFNREQNLEEPHRSR